MTMSQEIKSLNQERYAAAAANYVSSSVHATGMGLPRLLELAETQADWLVLDVATGGGHTALHFAPLAGQVIASDFTETMLRGAKEFIEGKGHENVLFSGADAEVLPFAANSFNLITCRVAAHHFPHIAAFMGEAFRVLKPNGILLVHDHVVSNNKKVANYVNAYEKLRDPAHARALPEYEWKSMFTNTGFAIEVNEQFTIEHEVLPWAKRQHCSDETIEQLQIMLLRAPQKVMEWMTPRDAGTQFAYYTDHHIILKGRKPAK
jgi:ubiquinone/menaquinone biosynthesis C-methylase UbiE